MRVVRFVQIVAGVRLSSGATATRLLARFRAIYLTADPRSLAAGRVALALVLLLDLFKRWVQLGSWYTNDGLVPNHTLLWRPSFTHEFSLFYLASYSHEAVIGFVLCALAYGALLVGVFTRTAQVLSLLCVLSLHGRILLFDNGGDVVLGLLCLWTCFLPTGRRFSVDAVLARRRGEPRSDAPVVSLAVLALSFQLALIYFFNAVHKSGETWREGSAIHYVLHFDRLVTPFGVWLRHHMPSTRLAAVVLVVALHGGIGLCMNLGVFVPAMIAFTPNLVRGQDWDALARWWPRSARRARLTAAFEARAANAIVRAEAALTPGRSVRVASPGPVVALLSRCVPALRELTVAAFIFVAANQVLAENQAAHRVIDHQNSPSVQAAVTYLNLFQGWSMFAPDVGKNDLNVSVDAVTIDGRHVDPWNEWANPRHPAPGMSIPERLDPNWLYYQYVIRMPFYPEFHQAFREWIMRYPQRTGRKQDEIVSYKVFKVEDDSPPPGLTEPTNARATLLFRSAPVDPPVAATASLAE
jgi:hypothetical protein